MGADIWSDEARLERLEAALDALREDSATGAPILVEGERDEAALRALGVPGPILKLHAGEGPFALAERLRGTVPLIILLVDWDERGGRFARQLREAFAANGVKLDDTHRKAISRAVGNAVKAVEDLTGYLRNLRAD